MPKKHSIVSKKHTPAKFLQADTWQISYEKNMVRLTSGNISISTKLDSFVKSVIESSAMYKAELAKKAKPTIN